MNTNWIAPAIIAAGTDEQKERLLPPIAAGKVLWCQGFSEPEAGSDLASMRMTAVRDGDFYVVNGQKIWTSYAHVAQYCFLLARTNPEVAKRRGISILLVPMDLPGIEVREIPSVLGRHAIHELFFDDVHVPVDCRLGAENEGWPLIRKVLANERIGAARFERSTRVLADGIAAARAGGPDDPVAAGQALATCEAARMLAYAAVQDRIDGRDDTGSASTSRVASVAAERAAAAGRGGDYQLGGGARADQRVRPGVRGGRQPGRRPVHGVDAGEHHGRDPGGAARPGGPAGPPAAEGVAMDLRLDSEQDSVVDAVRTLLRRTAGPREAGETSGRLDGEAMRRLSEAGFLDVASDGAPHDHLTALLVTEEAARGLVSAPVGARALVAAYAGVPDPPLTIGLALGQGSIVRWGADVDAVLMLQGATVRLLRPGDMTAERVPSRMTYPLARVTARPDRGEVVPGTARSGHAGAADDGAAARMTRAWRTVLAAE